MGAAKPPANAATASARESCSSASAQLAAQTAIINPKAQSGGSSP